MKRIALGLIGVALFVIVLSFFVFQSNLSVLDPHGPIALAERNLMATAALLMLIVVLPVFVLLFSFAWRYRERAGSHARYTPEWEHNRLEEFIWWAVPCVIIFALALITWQSSHALDPYQPLPSPTPPLEVEVVALEWKWLFIYPSLHVASLNYLEIPEDTPIDFHITADAPMNSFWIPELGGQIYAMPGMITELNLMASGAGTYAGSSANFSGDGFADMTFSVHAVSDYNFNAWTRLVRQGTSTLNFAAYEKLASAGTHAPAFYASVAQNLYTSIVDKYMIPSTTRSSMSGASI